MGQRASKLRPPAMILSRRCILVVDDDSDQRVGIAEVLEIQGYCVATAANGWEALELATSTSPSLIPLDLEMPIMTGCELISALRRSVTLRDIPVMVVTGQKELPSDVVSLVKPVRIEKLLECSEGVLARSTPAIATEPSPSASAEHGTETGPKKAHEGAT